MAEYMNKYHRDLIDEYVMYCPYSFADTLTDNFVSSIWATFDAVMPDTKIRLVDHYLNECVVNPVMAAKIRRIDQITVDTFEVLDVDYEQNRATLLSTTTNDVYKTVAGANVMHTIQKGDIQTYMIHPWEEDGSYNIGAVLNHKPEKSKG